MADAGKQQFETTAVVVAPAGIGRKFAAAAVHTFTASGILCALLATLAAAENAFALAFAWLGLALVIDGIDGTFARWVDVSRHLARFSGERLDQVVDYVTYVFVPTLALLKSGILAGGSGVALAGVILMTSLFHFADNGNKSEDHCFVGFPAIWNIVAFYLFAFPLPAWGSALIVLLCAGLTFVPMRWLHPMRVERRLALNLAASGLWLAAAGSTLWHGFPAPLWAGTILVTVGIYALALSIIWPWAEPSGGDDAA